MHNFTIVLLGVLVVLVASMSVPRKSAKEHYGLLKQNKSDCAERSNDWECVCAPCKSVISFLRMMILEHKMEDKELLEKACVRFYGNDPTHRAFCEKVVEEHLEMILDFVRQKMDPTEICHLFC